MPMAPASSSTWCSSRPSQPPTDVRQAFVDVNAAQQDAVRVQNEAETFASRVVPKPAARRRARSSRRKAYREQSIADATGQAARFSQVYEEYRKAPGRHPRAHLPRDHGARVRRRRQDDRRPETARASCPSCPSASCTPRRRSRRHRAAAGSDAMNSSALRTAS